MELQEFRAKAYEILTVNGYKEIDGKMYYPESSVMDMLEWMAQQIDTLPSANSDVEMFKKALDRAFEKAKK